MLKMTKYIALICAFFMLIVLIEPNLKKAPDIATIKLHSFNDDGYYSINEKLCLQFLMDQDFPNNIKNNYSYQKMIYTGYNDRQYNPYTLYMLYCAKENNKQEFDKVLTQLDINQYPYFDQLVILKALLIAHQNFGQSSYKELAFEVEEVLSKSFKTEGMTETYYLDLATLKALSTFKKEWAQVYKTSRSIIKNGYIGNNFPFYKMHYDYDNHTYGQEKEIIMEKTLMSVLFLAEEGECKEQTIEWLKETLKSDKVYIAYDKNEGIPLTNVESSNIYALIAQIGKAINDRELHTLAIEHMIRFQVIQSNDQVKGYFINQDTVDIDYYSNVQALLAF